MRTLRAEPALLEHVEVRVDHPFLAFIFDGVTGEILFAGVINDPSQ
jgi:serine protease inhibitor